MPDSYQKGLVSVIMAAYNAELHIADAIASLQAQTYTHWELWVVNDGSQDKTEHILRALAARDPRIHVVSQTNQGVSAARNAGLKRMRGEYFLIFDADDLLPPHSLSCRVQLLRQNPNVYFADGFVAKKDAEMQNDVEQFRPTHRGSPHALLLRLNSACFGLPSWLIRRDPNRTYRMPTDMSHAEDLLFYVEISENQAHLYDFVEQDVLYYRIHDNSAMRKLDGLENGYIKLYQRFRNDFAAPLSLSVYLKYRISRIMFLSFLRQKNIFKAFRSLWRVAKA